MTINDLVFSWFILDPVQQQRHLYAASWMQEVS